MIAGLGTDLVEIHRIAEITERKGEIFIKTILTENEMKICPDGKKRAEFIAGRFAAKEAIAKALGCGFGAKCAILDIEILNNTAGMPEITLRGAALKTAQEKNVNNAIISITHEKSIAAATAVLER